MSIRISLDNPPDFFTNLDLVRGRIVLGITRHEQVGVIIVKLTAFLGDVNYLADYRDSWRQFRRLPRR